VSEVFPTDGQQPQRAFDDGLDKVPCGTIGVDRDVSEVKEEKEVKVSGDEKKVNGEEKKVNGDVKKDGEKKERASPDKKDEKKAGAKDLKDKLETPKGLTKEKSNVDKKSKPAKK
jgi:hypothetical protein